MTYQEAVEEMKVLAAGKDWALTHETASYIPIPQIHGYIAGGGGHAETAITYSAAINKVKKMLGIITEPHDAPPEDGEAKPCTS